MKPSGHVSIVWKAAFIALVAGFIAGAARAQPAEERGGPPPARVVVAPVTREEVLTRITLLGSAESWLQTVVASQADGLVEEMLADEGDRVTKGQVLCRQDATLLKSRIKAAEASLEETKVRRAQAMRELERQSKLFQRQSVSEKAYEDAQFQADAFEKQVFRLKAELAELKDMLEMKTVKAPVSGYVVNRSAQVGQWLSEGQAVVTMVVLDPIRLIVPVPELYIDQIVMGGKTRVTFDGLAGREFEGTVSAIVPKGDDASRNFPVRIHISNTDSAIKAGMLGRAEVPVGVRHPALLAPKDALVLDSCGASVFVVRDELAVPVNVKMGPAHGDLIEINAPLQVGEYVVVRGNERLTPGQKVTVIGSMDSQQETATSKEDSKLDVGSRSES